MKQNNVNYEQQQLHSLLPLGEGGRRPDEGADVVRSYTLETAKGGQQSLHSLRPMGEGGRRPDEGLKETVRCNSDEMLKQVQHDGKGLAKDAQSQCPPLETLPNKNNPVDCFCERKPEFSIPRRGTKNYDVTRHKAAEPASCKSLVPKCLSNLVPFRKAAFTLAEVLITLAVIGIVAALTLPGLIQNHNEKAWSTAKDLWEKKLTETVRRMNTDGVMTGHDSTEDFMDTFKQYMKVIKTCDNTDINKCYSPKVVTTGSNEEPMEVETDGLKTASDMGLKSWQTNTNTMSFVVADGTTVIMAYQPECPYADPIEDTGSQVSCMGYMVDVNGKKGPNRVGKDIQLSSGVAFSTCDNPIGDMCFSTDFRPTAINTCSDGTEEDKAYDQTGDSNDYCATNYWAGAKKACDQKNMELPTMAQLAQLASNLYVASDGSEITIGAMENKNSGTIKVKDQYKDNLPITFDKFYWSSEEDDMNTAYARRFGTSLSRWDCKGKQYSYGHAVCISN